MLKIHRNSITFLKHRGFILGEREELKDCEDEREFHEKLHKVTPNQEHFLKDFLDRKFDTVLMCNIFIVDPELDKNDQKYINFSDIARMSNVEVSDLKFLLFFSPNKNSVVNEEIRRFYCMISNHSLNGGIFVYFDNMKSPTKNHIDMKKPKNLYIDYCSVHNFIPPVSSSWWAPKNNRLIIDGKKYLKEQGILIADAVKILPDDPLCIYLNAKGGNLIIVESRVMIPDTMCKLFMEYRLVVGK